MFGIHSELDGLYRAVLLDPTDDTARLTCADWLEEHGNADRADFIRVQCELERYRNGNGGDCYAGCPKPGIGCRRCDLHRRERGLLREHVENWLPVLGYVWWLENSYAYVGGPGDEPKKASPHYRAEFRRGFVASITLTCEQFVGGVCKECADGYLPTEHHGNMHDTLHGTGRTPGLVVDLFRAAPIEEVRLSDKTGQCEDDGTKYHWTNEAFERMAPCSLLPELFRIICPNATDSFEYYASQKQALTALSRGCVTYGRRKAQLDIKCDKCGEYGARNKTDCVWCLGRAWVRNRNWSHTILAKSP